MAQLTQSWSDFFTDLQTGDILLMHGQFISSIFIEKISGCEWSHAAIAVQPGDIGLDPLTGNVLLWESNIKNDPDDGRVKDVILNQTKNGPMLDKLKERITNNYNQTPKKFDSAFAKRKLNFSRTPAMFKMLLSVINDVHSADFPAIPEGELENYLKGVGENKPVTDNTFFCSQLVAHTYKAWGFLGSDWVDNSYAPVNFSQGKKDSKLLLGATLGEEIRLDVSTIPAYPG